MRKPTQVQTESPKVPLEPAPVAPIVPAIPEPTPTGLNAEQLRWIYEKQLDWLGKGDSKAWASIAITGAMFTVVAAIFDKVKPLPNFAQTLMVLIALALAVSLFSALHAISPILRILKDDKTRSAKSPNSNIYFRHIASFTEEYFGNRVETVDPEGFKEDLKGQVWAMAVANTEKFRSVHISYLVNGVAAAFLVALLIYFAVF